VAIPSSVASIGVAAFQKCAALVSVSIPDSVRSIGRDAFAECSSLVSVSIAGSATSIGRSAFRDCAALTSIPQNCDPSAGEMSSSGLDVVTSEDSF
jgi:hypothetical protein